MKRIFSCLLAGTLSALGIVVSFSGCTLFEKPVVYEITVSGTLEEAGAVHFLGYSFNVYQDQASNPCGTCSVQPAHLYVGDTAADVAETIRAVVEKADDLWKVNSSDESGIILEEKSKDTVGEIGALTAPAGITMTGKITQGSAGSAKTSGEKTVAMPENPQRLAALYGPSYEALVVLGAEDRIVLRADVQTENLPWAEVVFRRISGVTALLNVHTSVSAEETAKAKPDLVFSFPRQNELDQFAALGIAAYSAKSPQTLQEVKAGLAGYAAVLGGDAPNKAREYAQYFDEKLAMITERTSSLPDSERPRVYYAGMEILSTYGKYSDITDVILAAGGVSVSAELNAGNRSQINYEQLIAYRPDWIFIDHGGINGGKTAAQIKAELLSDGAYGGIPAVEQGNVVLSPSGVFYWDMGLQKILLVMDMAKTLHPELFPELDMNAEVREFYEKFYDYPLTEQQAEKILHCENP